MKRTATLIFCIICLTQYSYGQTSFPSTPPTGWERIYIKDVGSFDLPPSMEIQKGQYKEFMVGSRKIMGLAATQITAQPKGLNELNKNGLKKYARVMLETKTAPSGSFEKLNFKVSKYTPSDIRELNSAFKQQLQESFIGTGLKLIQWYPLKLDAVNGMSCIHVSYKRQFQDKPLVLVHMYYFQNYDRMHTLTLSYRISEASDWKSDFARILQSFRITNIR